MEEQKTIKKWKTIDSEYLIKRPWLTARKDRVQLPNGTIHDEYYVLEYPTWINVIAITTEGEFVMVEQYRHGLDDVFIELCAGVVDEGETPLEGARRELMEETGYSGGTWKLINKISPNPTTCTNFSYCYLAEGVVKTSGQHLDETEDVAVRLLSKEQVFELLKNDEIKQALMAAPLWHYFAMDGRP